MSSPSFSIGEVTILAASVTILAASLGEEAETGEGL